MVILPHPNLFPPGEKGFYPALTQDIPRPCPLKAPTPIQLDEGRRRGGEGIREILYLIGPKNGSTGSP